MDDNVLSKGVETLYTMKENLLELEGYKQQSTSLALKENQLEKQIALKESEITEEATNTIKKRKLEVESSYNEQIDKIKTKIKKAKAKKDKEKSAQVSERIKSETSDLSMEKVRLKEELKAVYEKNHIPAIFNNGLYHALFMPRCLKDIGIILLTIVVTLFIIPYGIYILLLPEKTIFLIIDYIITVVLFGGLYLLINNKTKENHSDAVIDIRAIRAKQAKNQKRINATAKEIRKDKDESTYSLDDYNQEIVELDNELKAISEEKKEALVEFETSTRHVIEKEIRDRSAADMDNLKKEHEQACAEEKQADEKVKLFTIEIANKYESYIGKEMMSPDKIDALIELIQTEKASNIAQALTVYKEQQNIPVTTKSL